MALFRSIAMAIVVLSAGSWWIRAETPEAARRALLVGCTRYPGLAGEHQLEGPGNDVALMRDLLRTRFGFSAEAIATLAEDVGGPERRPTRANIERAFRALARESRRGDHVVILLAGHGTQQPDVPPDAINDPEPDGLDEVFMPADALPAGRGSDALANVIVDDDLKIWLAEIQRTGASIWLIVDACHSGTMVRGRERLRQVDPQELGISAEALKRTRSRAEVDFGKAQVGQTGVGARFELPAPVDGDVVAIYAAQPDEPTVELPLPQGIPGARCHGLLTYTLSEVLTRARTPISYRQLVQQVHARYSALDRQFPTPMIEGRGQHAIVLDEARSVAARIRLAHDDEHRWAIDAGALHGLTPGTILAVGTGSGRRGGDEIQGYVRIAENGFQPHRALVVPCENPVARGPVVAGALVEESLCWPVRIEYVEVGLKVGADDRDNRGRPLPPSHRERLAAVVRGLHEAISPRGGRDPGAAEDGHGTCNRIQIVAEPAEADWLLHLRLPGEDGLYLMPNSGLAPAAQVGGRPPIFGPAPAGALAVPWLRESLTRIAGSRILLRIAGGAAGPALGEATELGLEVAMLRFSGAEDHLGQVLAAPGHEVEVRDGDVVGFRLRNTGPDAIDVTLLLVDSSYGITPHFPIDAGQDNRLRPGNTLTRRFEVTVDVPGLEHLIVIAVRARPHELAADFSFLAQSSLAQARDFGVARGHAQGGLDSPLGRLLQESRFARGTTRSSYAPLDPDDCAMQVITWRTVGR